MTELWDRSSSYSFPRLRSVKVALPSAHVNEVIVSDGAVKLRVVDGNGSVFVFVASGERRDYSGEQQE